MASKINRRLAALGLVDDSEDMDLTPETADEQDMLAFANAQDAISRMQAVEALRGQTSGELPGDVYPAMELNAPAPGAQPWRTPMPWQIPVALGPEAGRNPAGEEELTPAEAAELAGYEKEAAAKAAAPDTGDLTPAEAAELAGYEAAANAPPETPWGIYQPAADFMSSNVIEPVAGALENYISKPTRGFVGSLMGLPEGIDPSGAALNKQMGVSLPTSRLSPEMQQNILSALKYALPLEYQALGVDLGKTPTAKALVGASPEELGGMVTEGVVDPMNLLALGPVKTGIKTAAQATGRAVLPRLGRGAAQVAGTLTGIHPDLISAYASDLPGMKTIQATIPEGMSAKEHLFHLENEYKKRMDHALAAERIKASKQLGKAIRDASEESRPGLKRFTTIYDSLGDIAQVKSNRETRALFKSKPEIEAALDAMAEKLKSMQNKRGSIGPSRTHQLKQYFQEIAEPIYMKESEVAALPKSKQAMRHPLVMRTAQKIAAALNEDFRIMVPAGAEANDKLATIHRMLADSPTNLLKTHTSGSYLQGLVTGARPDITHSVKEVSRLTGQDFVKQGKKIAAARAFEGLPWIPVDATGKAVARQLTGSALLAGLGLAVGGPGTAILTAAMTSPMALKTAIHTGKFTWDALSRATGVTGAMTDAKLTAAWQALRASQRLQESKEPANP